jgi:hypothetical protein
MIQQAEMVKILEAALPSRLRVHRAPRPARPKQGTWPKHQNGYNPERPHPPASRNTRHQSPALEQPKQRTFQAGQDHLEVAHSSASPEGTLRSA